MKKYIALTLLLVTPGVFAHDLSTHAHILGVHVPEFLTFMAILAITKLLINKRRHAKKID